MKKILIFTVLMLISISAYAQYNTGIGDGYSSGNELVNVGLLAPMLLSPINEDTIKSSHVEMVWNSVPDADYYILNYSNAENIDEIYMAENRIEDTSILLGPLDSFKYYWRVRAVNDKHVSDWSEIKSFYIKYKLSVPEITNENHFSVYPNPASNEINISFDFQLTNYIELTVTNFMGIVVKELFINSLSNDKNTLNINLSDLATGMYIITIKTSSFTESKKISIVR
ncbi:MAG TPA: T9SS type A sorting domain-containing protein [Candidatus Kapabacteria bacterium]|nr:T9SS type A sorting domain-containing protein [Candidatus Kapabacteria bacterium]HPO61844.1 T9SS type A sorting domain-containing protein [Candidatus Kapabacteria bacterium]